MSQFTSAMANSDRKCKCVVLSTESKLSVLDSVAKGVGYSELSVKFGIGKLMITTLNKNEATIHEFASTLESTSMSKGINKKDVVHMCADVWDDIPAVTLTTSWNKLLASDKTTYSDQQPEDAHCQG